MNGHVRVLQYLRLAAECLIYDVMFERVEWIARLYDCHPKQVSAQNSSPHVFLVI